MSRTHTTGQRVRITIALDPETLPIGTLGTVTGECIGGYYVHPDGTPDGTRVPLIPGQLLPA